MDNERFKTFVSRSDAAIVRMNIPVIALPLVFRNAHGDTAEIVVKNKGALPLPA